MHKIHSGAYQIVNEVNGKSYVGSSKDINSRWRDWKRNFKVEMKYKSLLKAAVQKYGIDNFTFILLEECEPTKDALEAIEQKYIDLLKPEYNILPQAYSPAGHKLSEEQKQRMRDTYSEERKQAMSERAKAYMSDPEIRAKYSELRKGKTFEEIFGEEAKEVLERQSQGRTGKRLGIPSWNKGVPITEEQKAVLNAARDAWQEEHGAWNKGVPLSAEAKQKISKALTGKEAWNRGTTGLMPEPWNKGLPVTEEERQRLIEISKANFTTEHQTKMTEAARQANLGKERSEATKQKISEANLASDARKAFTDSRRGVARSDELKQRVSEGIRSSEAFQASVKARVGKIRKDNTSGHYGIVWDKSRGKWLVRVNKKQCGRFADLGEAIACRDAAIG